MLSTTTSLLKASDPNTAQPHLLFMLSFGKVRCIGVARLHTHTTRGVPFRPSEGPPQRVPQSRLFSQHLRSSVHLFFHWPVRTKSPSSDHNTCLACRCDWTSCSVPLGLHVPSPFVPCALARKGDLGSPAPGAGAGELSAPGAQGDLGGRRTPILYLANLKV